MIPSKSLPPNDDHLNRYVGFSVIVHVTLILIFTIKSVFFSGPPIEYQSAVRVDLVGLPDKAMPEKITPASPAPPAPETAKPIEKPAPPQVAETEKTVKPKVLPKRKPEIDHDAVNLDKTKTKEREAVNRLKQMSAFEKIQQELDDENQKKAAAARSKVIKGNVISTGSQLTGLSRLQADTFISEVEKQIRQNWSLPQWLARKNLSAQIRVRFDEKGNILSAQIVKSSGNPAFDEIVVDTVHKAAPLPPPPEKFVRLMNVEGILFGFPE